MWRPRSVGLGAGVSTWIVLAASRAECVTRNPCRPQSSVQGPEGPGRKVIIWQRRGGLNVMPTRDSPAKQPRDTLSEEQIDLPHSWDDLFKDTRFHLEEVEEVVNEIAGRWRERGFSNVHDLGCGAGRHSAFLQLEGFEVTGSDISPHGLTACRERLSEADLRPDLVLADMCALPFDDGVFDATISINVLNHGSRELLQLAVDEIRRTLRPGGEALIKVLNSWDWRFGSGVETEPNTFVLAEGPEQGIMHHFFDEDDLRTWLGDFELVDLTRERIPQNTSTAPGDRPVNRDCWEVLVRRPQARA